MTYPLSSDVVAGQPTAAEHYNNYAPMPYVSARMKPIQTTCPIFYPGSSRT